MDEAQLLDHEPGDDLLIAALPYNQAFPNR